MLLLCFTSNNNRAMESLRCLNYNNISTLQTRIKKRKQHRRPQAATVPAQQPKTRACGRLWLHPSKGDQFKEAQHCLAGPCLLQLTPQVRFTTSHVHTTGAQPHNLCVCLHSTCLAAVSPVEASGSSASGAGSAVIITLQPPLPPRTELQRRQALAALNRSKQLYQQQGSKLHLSKQLDLLTLHPVSLHQQYAMGVGVYAGRAAAACQTRQLDQDIREQEGQTDQVNTDRNDTVIFALSVDNCCFPAVCSVTTAA